MLTLEEFRLFRNLVYQESGIYLKETRKDFLENRLMKRLSATGICSPYWYYKFITEAKKTELLIFLDLLTVNETAFFRNPPQMELFGNILLPDIMKGKARDTRKTLRIWSAGCSTGEEPYSIAMIVHDAVSRNLLTPPFSKEEQNEPGWDISIYASDLSLTSLEKASRGEYAGDKVRGVVDSRYLAGYFEPKGDGYKVTDEIRKMVVFDFHNLKNENGLCGLDIIFCRNVMIYFDEDEQRRLIDKFYASLECGGCLLLGHSESLHGMDSRFEFIYDNRGIAYRKPKNAGMEGD